MKTKLFLAGILFFCILLSDAQDVFKIYNYKFSSKKILGNKGTRFLSKFTWKTTLMQPPAQNINMLAYLGSMYTTTDMQNPTDLLNEISTASTPLLDTINFTFYTNYAFTELVKTQPALRTDKPYQRFKAEFLKSNYAQKKALMQEDSNYREVALLESRRILRIMDSIKVTGYDSLVTDFKFKIVADIQTRIKKILNLEANTKVSLEDKYVRNVTIEKCYYREYELNPRYIDCANDVIRHYIGKDKMPTAKLQGYSDVFSRNLTDLLSGCNGAIVAGAAVFEIALTESSANNLLTGVEASVKAELMKKDSVSATAADASKIIKANAEAALGFEVKHDHGTTVVVPTTFYYVKYGFVPKLELGRCGIDPKNLTK